jgi:hypothetical protein
MPFQRLEMFAVLQVDQIFRRDRLAVPATPFSEGIEPMTDDEPQIAQAIARAFETLSERLSKVLEDAFNQIAQLMGRAQKQQYEIVALLVSKRQQ